jgi:hypothetical protein
LVALLFELEFFGYVKDIAKICMKNNKLVLIKYAQKTMHITSFEKLLKITDHY